jgi:hypothetical protein
MKQRQMWFLFHCAGEHLRGPHSKVHRSLQEKWTAAQQRQYQRDRRRRYTNPYRTQAEEDAERLRKHEQGIFDRRRDPYNRQQGDHEYAYYREKRLEEDCKRNGVSCNYHALDWDACDRRYDYDPIHREHYRGTPYDRHPHDTTRMFDP